MKQPWFIRSGLLLLLAVAPCGYGQDAGLVGRWTFDDPANLGKDQVAAHQGMLTPGVSSFASSRIGAGALAVDGVSGRLEVPDSPDLRFLSDQSFTVSAWVYVPDLPGAWKGIVAKSREAAPWYGLWISAQNQWVTGGGANIVGPEVASDWHLVTSVQDGTAGTRDLYVDGELVASGSAANADGPGSLWIGGAAGVSEFFSGVIDDVRIYNRALAATEVAQLFAAANPSSSLPLALLVQPEDVIGAPGDKARFVARANALNLTYQWYRGNTPVGTASPAPFAGGGAEAVFTSEALSAADNASTYSVVFTGSLGSVTSRVAQVSIVEPVFSPGFLKRELYLDIPGSTMADLPADAKFPDAPDAADLISLFETPPNLRDNYGQRLTGLIAPWESGNYVFYLAADDQAELYLGTDDSPVTKQLIATEPQWNPSRYWVGTDRRNPDAPENISAPISLEAGRRYYVEVLHKEGTGGDSLAVKAMRAGEPAPENGSTPLGGAFIGVLAAPTGQSISITNQPADVLTNELARVVFTMGAAASGTAPLAFQWQRNGTSLWGANEASYTTPPITAADQGAKYRCVVSLPGNVSATTREAVLTVDLDTTPPVLTGVLAPLAATVDVGNEVYVTFDELVDPASATNRANYTLAPASAINAITLRANRRSVVLGTDDLAPGNDYTLTVKDVTDASVARNRLVTTSRTFQVSALIAHYTFDEAGNLGADQQSINPGTPVGGATYSPDSRVGDGTLQVNGSNGRIEVPDSPMLRFTLDQSYTVCAWAKAEVLSGGWRGIVNKSRNTGSFYGIWLSDGGQWIAGGNNIAGPSLTAGWHHVAVVQDGVNGTREMYLDGASVVTGAAIAGTGTGPLWIGGAAGVTEFFNGFIDDVRLYNRPLTAEAIHDLATLPLPAPRVSLTIALNANAVQLSWPTNAVGFGLESTTALGSANWQAVTRTPEVQADRYSVTLPVDPFNHFYRLKQ